jgi:hypothetical protein
LENYREHLSINEQSKGNGERFLYLIYLFFHILELSVKSVEDLLQELSFLSKRQLSKEVTNSIPRN